MFARRRQTFVDVRLTIDAIESGTGAVAQKSAQFVLALATMLTRLRFAIVDIDFAIPSRHAIDADTRVIGNAVNACRTV